MSKQQRQNNLIEESSSPLFQAGFFVGVQKLQEDTYNCATCLTVLKERGYTVNSGDGQEFIAGWKFSNQ